MFGAFDALGARALPPFRLRSLLLTWAVAEVVALAFAVKLFGLGATILLMALSSILGVVLLRRTGLEAAQRVRQAMAGQSRDGALADGTLAAFGALLLILPGFVSDIAGLALAAPSIRHKIWTRLGVGGGAPEGRVPRRGPADVIDLSPSDWRAVEPSRHQ